MCEQSILQINSLENPNLNFLCWWILRLTLKKKKKQQRYTITGLTSSPEYDPLQEAKFA